MKEEDRVEVFLLLTGNNEGGARDSYVTDGHLTSTFLWKRATRSLLALRRSEKANEWTL